LVQYRLAEIEDICVAALSRHGLALNHARALARVLTAGERDECRSHGVYRLAGCIKTIGSPHFNRGATPSVATSNGPVVRVNADFGFSCLPLELGAVELQRCAERFGLAALIINNCFHFSALWYEVEMLAERGLAALAMNPSMRSVAPAGGTKALFGTNPIAFAWPRPGHDPYVFDFATSEVARGEVELHRQNDRSIPLGWALGPDGAPTTDPAAAIAGAMLTFGGHKGSALSTMIELLAGPLINDKMSFESSEFDSGAGAAPCHGELIIAFSPEKLLGADADDAQQRAEQLFSQIVGQGARLPSQRRYEARKRSIAKGVDISDVQDAILRAL
jgi:delta1-piperideine-2-carboxylate reductase